MSILNKVILTNYRPRKDKSVSLSFATQEITDNELLKIHNSVDKFGVLYFAEKQVLTETEIKEIEDANIKNENGKSKSQQLRHVLYRLWEQEGNNEMFTDYYAGKMNTLIEHFKDKLE